MSIDGGHSIRTKSWLARAKETAAKHKEYCIRDNTWTIKMTATILFRSYGSVNEDLMIDSWIKSYPKIEDMKTLKEARSFIRNKKKEIKLR